MMTGRKIVAHPNSQPGGTQSDILPRWDSRFLDTRDLDCTAGCAHRLDEADPLSRFKDRFFTPKNSSGEKLTYLNGNSLGLLSKQALAFILDGLRHWAALGVEGHWAGKLNWLEIHQPIREAAADVLGAAEKEVVAMGSLTANLDHLLVKFYAPAFTIRAVARHKIIIMGNEFPSDRYAADSHIRFHGFDPHESLIQIAPDAEIGLIDPQKILDAIHEHGDTLSGILIGDTNYLTGQHFAGIPKIVQAAHTRGAWVGVDYAHAAGSTNLQLHDEGVDWGVGCSYKHLNAGAGGIGLLYVHERHLKAAKTAHNFLNGVNSLPRRFLITFCDLFWFLRTGRWGETFKGWWSNRLKTRFRMPEELEPHEDSAEVFQMSNPSVHAMLPLFGTLANVREAGWTNILRKIRTIGGYAEFLLRNTLPSEIGIITPENPGERGAQLSMKVTADLRSPEFCARLDELRFVDRFRQEARRIVFTHPEIYQGLDDEPIFRAINKFCDEHLPGTPFLSKAEREFRNRRWTAESLGAERPDEAVTSLLLNELVEMRFHNDELKSILQSGGILFRVLGRLAGSTLQDLLDDREFVKDIQHQSLDLYIQKKGIGGIAETLGFEGILRVFGVVCDYREPGIIRIAPVLYNSYEDVKKFVDVLEMLLKDIPFA